MKIFSNVVKMLEDYKMTDFTVFQQSPENVALLHILSNMENNGVGGGGVEGSLLFGFTMVGLTNRNMFKKSGASDPEKVPFKGLSTNLTTFSLKLYWRAKAIPPAQCNF